MRRRLSVSAYVIFGLIAIGILYKLAKGQNSLWIPILVFGIVFLLYKFPPNRLRRTFNPRHSARVQTKPKRKPTTFRVINGNKTDDDNDLPKYH